MEQQVVRKGYKQTELGVIPSDWSVKSIGQFCSVSSGGTPNREIRGYWNGEIPWVTTALIDGNEISEALEFITERGLSGSSAKWFPRNTILMAMYGQGKTRGKVGILAIDATINQACAGIIVNSEDREEYVFYYLRSAYERIRDLSNAGGQENLSGSIVRDIKVPLPSLGEQAAITKALSDSDALINSLEKLINKKRSIKTAAMQQLLTGKKRLPGFDKHSNGKAKGTKQTELGEIPEDWEHVELGSLTHIKTGSMNNQDKSSDGIYPFYVRSQNVERINSYSYDCEAILIPGEGNIGKIFHYVKGKFDAHQRVYVIRDFSESCSAKYLFYYLKQYFGGHAMENSVKATVDSLRLPTFVGFNVLKPKSKDEQDAVAEVLSNLDQELATLEKRLKKTQQIKQAVMKELLTGRTRLA